jgi:glucose/arabinose dehydrogenase
MSRNHLVLCTAIVAALTGCSGPGATATAPGPTTAVEPATASRAPFTGAPELDLDGAAVRVVASGFRIPWGLEFLPDGTALVTERGNDVPLLAPPAAGGPAIDDSGVARILRVTPDGAVTEVQQLPEVDLRSGEGGLLGIAVSPHYTADGLVYIYYSAATDNRVARLRLGQAPQPILTGIPVRDDVDGSRYHQGGRLAFGPDGMLYVSVGETYLAPELAQDPGSLGGKILRITPDGRPAPGNPFPDSAVWSFGHRNVQGLAWDADGRMYASEFGQKNVDELNRIEPGRNYGWPTAEGPSADPAFTNPIASWTPTRIASPSGIAVAGGHVYLACLAGQTLYRVDLDGRDPRRLLDHQFGRLRTVTVAPDGALWVTTSNLDRGGREFQIPAGPEGDRILRIELPR